MEAQTQKRKAELKAEIKQLTEQHQALEVTYQRWTRTKREIQKRLDEIEQEQLRVSVARWRAENEAGVEQLQMF